MAASDTMTITYRVGDSLYLNITNRCHCRCVFCVRIDHDGVGDGENLWLAHEPSLEEVTAALDRVDLTAYKEAVFCGYGEPAERIDLLLDTCRYLRKKAPGLPVRVNTNGLGDRINGREILPLMQGLVDSVSISLNAPNAARYRDVTRPSYGEEAFAVMLRFAEESKHYIPDVRFSVVDVLDEDEIEVCKHIANEMNIPLRVRVRS